MFWHVTSKAAVLRTSNGSGSLKLDDGRQPKKSSCCVLEGGREFNSRGAVAGPYLPLKFFDLVQEDVHQLVVSLLLFRTRMAARSDQNDELVVVEKLKTGRGKHAKERIAEFASLS
jgi:hypothetical protein